MATTMSTMAYAVIHLDTEQSLHDHDTLNDKVERRAGAPRPPWFKSWCLTGLNASQIHPMIPVLEAIYCKPGTSAPHPGHEIYPYLLRNKAITGPDQVWCADITDLPRRHGFMYLMAVMDWWSRFVLAWELSNTLEAAFCVQTWQLALARGNQPPLISNTDQGAQFTSADYVGAVQEAGVLVSMDGRGRWMDNRFVERLWRSLKYEDIYLRGYEHGLELRQGVGNWFGDYNDARPHQALGYATPAEVYRAPESHGAKPASWA
jgi:putative transposase